MARPSDTRYPPGRPAPKPVICKTQFIIFNKNSAIVALARDRRRACIIVNEDPSIGNEDPSVENEDPSIGNEDPSNGGAVPRDRVETPATTKHQNQPESTM